LTRNFVISVWDPNSLCHTFFPLNSDPLGSFFSSPLLDTILASLVPALPQPWEMTFCDQGSLFLFRSLFFLFLHIFGLYLLSSTIFLPRLSGRRSKLLSFWCVRFSWSTSPLFFFTTGVFVHHAVADRCYGIRLSVPSV